MGSLIIIGWIFYSVYFAVKRGFKLEISVFLGYLLAGYLAFFIYPFFWRTFSLYIPYVSVTNEKPLYFYSQVNVFKIEESFYKIVSFMIFYFSFCMLIRFLEVFIKGFQLVPTSKFYQICAGIMGLITAIFGIYLILSVLAMLPLKGLQNSLSHSFLVNFILKGPMGWIFNRFWF